MFLPQSLEDILLLHVWLASVLCFYWLRGRGCVDCFCRGAQVFAFSGILLAGCRTRAW